MMSYLVAAAAASRAACSSGRRSLRRSRCKRVFQVPRTVGKICKSCYDRARKAPRW
jgi:hypothetical protein